MSRLPLRNWLRFRVERLLLRGAHYRLVFIAAMVGIISIIAGLAASYVEPSLADPGDAVWWAFLQLTDPGYLGDAVGVELRAIATLLTVIGLALFVGSLVAIMTQWLSQTLRNLERGYTPVAVRDHILVLGWTNRTGSVLHELLLSRDRARRFMRRFGKRRLVIVALIDDVNAELVQRLKDDLGGDWDARDIILRSGNALHVDDLQRVAFSDAAAVIVPAADYSYGGPESADTRFIKTVMTIGHAPLLGERRPLLVGEIFDHRKLQIARRAYGGPIEILASHRFIARLLTQTLRHPGISRVFAEILGHSDGNEIYIRPCREFVGRCFDDIDDTFPRAVLLGFVGPSGDSFSPVLSPAGETCLQETDNLVLLARTFDDTSPEPLGEPIEKPATAVAVDTGSRSRIRRRVLLLGWNHKAPALLAELADYAGESFDVVALSAAPVAEREGEVERQRVDATALGIQMIEGDYTLPDDLRSIEPVTFDVVILLPSDRADSSEEADARCCAGLLVLEDALADAAQRPQIIVEVLDDDNAHLVLPRTEALVSPVLLSHMLAQVALRRELRSVFDELFGPGGAVIGFDPLAQIDVGSGPVTFSGLRESCRARGQVALGVRRTHSGSIELNPNDEQVWDREELADVVTLSVG